MVVRHVDIILDAIDVTDVQGQTPCVCSHDLPLVLKRDRLELRHVLPKPRRRKYSRAAPRLLRSLILVVKAPREAGRAFKSKRAKEGGVAARGRGRPAGRHSQAEYVAPLFTQLHASNIMRQEKK